MCELRRWRDLGRPSSGLGSCCSQPLWLCHQRARGRERRATVMSCARHFLTSPRRTRIRHPPISPPLGLRLGQAACPSGWHSSPRWHARGRCSTASPRGYSTFRSKTSRRSWASRRRASRGPRQSAASAWAALAAPRALQPLPTRTAGRPSSHSAAPSARSVASRSSPRARSPPQAALAPHSSSSSQHASSPASGAGWRQWAYRSTWARWHQCTYAAPSARSTSV